MVYVDEEISFISIYWHLPYFYYLQSQYDEQLQPCLEMS